LNNGASPEYLYGDAAYDLDEIKVHQETQRELDSAVACGFFSGAMSELESTYLPEFINKKVYNK
jgi:hypothetical protein